MAHSSIDGKFIHKWHIHPKMAHSSRSSQLNRVSNMVRKSPSPRELSLKLHGSFLPKSDFETFGHTGRDSEAFLAAWFFSGNFYQTRSPKSQMEREKLCTTICTILFLIDLLLRWGRRALTVLIECTRACKLLASTAAAALLMGHIRQNS